VCGRPFTSGWRQTCGRCSTARRMTVGLSPHRNSRPPNRCLKTPATPRPIA
jgi:hypothetical protein